MYGIPDILKYGAIALGAIGLLYNFRLLQQELKKPAIQSGATGLIAAFMVFSLAILVGGVYLELHKLQYDVAHAVAENEAKAKAALEKVKEQIVQIDAQLDAKITSSTFHNLSDADTTELSKYTSKICNNLRLIKDELTIDASLYCTP